MDVNNKISSEVIEFELEIKLLDYLKENNFIDEEMYGFVINKLINKVKV